MASNYGAYNILWMWWDNASTNNRKDCMSQIREGGWLKNLPPKEQAQLFEYAPVEVKDYLPKWDEIHPQTLKLLHISIPYKGLESMMIPLRRK